MLFFIAENLFFKETFITFSIECIISISWFRILIRSKMQKPQE